MAARRCVARLGALIRNDKIYLAVSRAFNDFVCASTGHPSFDRHYLERVVLKSATSPLETRAYSRGTRWTRTKVAFVAFSLLLFARLMMLPALNFLALDLRDQTANVATARANSSAPVHRFLCLATNCSRLAPQQSYYKNHYHGNEAEPAGAAEQLARDFIRLPYFSLCYPTLSKLHDQSQFWEYFGTFMSSIFSFGILLGGCVFPLVQMARPNGGLFIMFVLEPALSRRILTRRIRGLLAQVCTTSYRNYCHSLLRRQLGRSSHLYVVSASNLDERAQYSPDGRLGAVRKSLLHARHCPEHLASEQIVLDCLPSTRTHWWRSRMAAAFAAFTLFSFGNFLAVELSGYAFVLWKYMPFRRRYLADVAQAVRQSNCSLWRTPANGGQDETGSEMAPPIELDALDMRFSWLFIVLDAANSWPYFCVCAFCAHYYCSFADVFCCLYEVQFQFDFAIEFMRRAAQNPSRHVEAAGAADGWPRADQQGACRQLVDMERVRAKFRTTVSIWYSFILCSSLRRDRHDQRSPPPAGSLLEHKFAMQEFVERAQPGRGQFARAAEVELLTKLYVDFRLLLDQIHEYGPIMAVVVILSTMLNYGYCCTCILYARKIQGFVFEPMVVAISAWTIANLFIILPSNFHAKTRKLQMQIWSLLAVAASSRDTRIEHLRLLWLKQLRHSEKSNGIAFTWLNMRITYVNIIQMMVWTATLCVVTLRV